MESGNSLKGDPKQFKLENKNCQEDLSMVTKETLPPKKLHNF